MIRTPLRPLARILRAREKGENPDEIEAELESHEAKDWEEQAENWTDDQILQAMQKLVEIQQRRRSDGR